MVLRPRADGIQFCGRRSEITEPHPAGGGLQEERIRMFEAMRHRAGETIGPRDSAKAQPIANPELSCGRSVDRRIAGRARHWICRQCDLTARLVGQKTAAGNGPHRAFQTAHLIAVLGGSGNRRAVLSAGRGRRFDHAAGRLRQEFPATRGRHPARAEAGRAGCHETRLRTHRTARHRRRHPTGRAALGPRPQSDHGGTRQIRRSTPPGQSIFPPQKRALQNGGHCACGWG